MSWPRGKDVVARLLADNSLEIVPRSELVIERLVSDGKAHIQLAEFGASLTLPDHSGRLQLAYDASRKLASALLAKQGLRATTRGGHVAVMKAVQAQFGGEGGVASFDRIDRLRRRRHATEYPDISSPTVSAADAEAAITLAKQVHSAVLELLGSRKLTQFE